MKLDRQLGCGLQGLYKLCSRRRNQQTGHILDADGISPDGLDFFGEVCPVVKGIGIAQGIGHGDLGVAAFLFCCLHCGLEVPHIVQAVENTDDIDAVCDGLLYEVLDDIISVGLVAENILSAEKHLQLRILEAGPELPQALPRIFLQKAEASIECGAAPALYGVIATLSILSTMGSISSVVIRVAIRD